MVKGKIKKKPIEWHKANLRNMVDYVTMRVNVVTKENVEIGKLFSDIDKLKRQIARAEKEGKTEFDRDKYLA